MDNEYQLTIESTSPTLDGKSRIAPHTASLSYTSHTTLDDLVFRLLSSGVEGDSQTLLKLAIGLQLLNNVMPFYQDAPQLEPIFTALMEVKNSVREKAADISVRKRSLSQR